MVFFRTLKIISFKTYKIHILIHNTPSDSDIYPFVCICHHSNIFRNRFLHVKIKFQNNFNDFTFFLHDSSFRHLLHSGVLDILSDTNRQPVLCNCRHSYTADNTMPSGNIVPYILRDIGKFCRDCTNRYSRIFYCILDRDLEVNKSHANSGINVDCGLDFLNKICI